MTSPWLWPLPRLVALLLLPLLTAGCGVPLALTAVSYGADGVSMATTNKTGADHLVSMSAKKDCALWRAFRNQAVCKERPDGHDPYNVDYTTPERSMSESGVQYFSPPRPPATAPASSWDAAVYKHAPDAPTQPAEPTTAIAEAAAPAAAVEVVRPAPAQKFAAHPKKSSAKAKARTAKSTKP